MNALVLRGLAGLAGVLVLAACGEKRGAAAPAGASGTDVSAGPVAEPGDSPAAAGDRVSPGPPASGSLASVGTAGAPAAAVVGAAVAPGLDRKRLIGPLRDAYDRMDPLKDGWESEAFSAAAMDQLHALEAVMAASGPVVPSALGPLATEDVAVAVLRPSDAPEVFDDGRLRVRRAGAAEPSGRGLAALADALNDLKRDASAVVPHFKIFRVTRDGPEAAVTAVVVEIEIEAAAERRQWNAEWSCRWRTEADAPPRLSEIRVVRHEEVVLAGGAPLFAEATHALLGGTAAYRDQLLVSTDFWRSRLPRDLGLDPVANHGLAIGDVNGDDLDDLYLCQQGGLPNRLFIQNPDGTLRDASAESGADWLDYCAAALLVDLDNDGDRDLAISQDFRLVVMANDGSGRFTRVFAGAAKAQSFSLAAADYDADGRVDLYVCGYNPSAAALRSGAMGEPIPFHDANNGGRNILWRNEGGWKFTDVTEAVGMERNNTRFSFAASWEDYDNDGDQDLYVANDYGRNCLYRNDGGTFAEVAADLGVEDTSSGMSVSWSDFNHDGVMDLYTSNMFSSAGNRITYQEQFQAGQPEAVRAQFQHIALGNTLFEGTRDGSFKDVSVDAGVTLGRWAWCSRFVDFNNDGWDDLLVANGFISTEDTGDL